MKNKFFFKRKRYIFPFTAIIGQEEMKLALLFNVIDPKIEGVMIMGNRGTGKSTTIRALTNLLPYIPVVKDDPFNSSIEDPELMGEKVRKLLNKGFQLKDRLKITGSSLSSDIANLTGVRLDWIKVPLVDLPLGATEDRVCGTIDSEKAIQEGIKAFEPGLLARANRGILYVDEVNLLDDHLVDVLLDAAASGWNTVEREGISIKHPSRFILIGSGNPEEGELRPQLLDRFDMHAQIKTYRDPNVRVRVVEERARFDRNPENSIHYHEENMQKLKNRIEASKRNLIQVKLEPVIQRKISKVCASLNIDGIRGDIVTNRAAKVYTAYHRRTVVTVNEVKAVIVLCLRHRLRKDPLSKVDSGSTVLAAWCRIFDLSTVTSSFTISGLSMP